jgi:hypothetical protein
VPALDTPLPQLGAAVWCGSFQLAWNEMKSNLASRPIQVAGAEAETVAEVETRAARPTEEPIPPFPIRDHLLVPEMAWWVEHRFRELEGPDGRRADRAVY